MDLFKKARTVRLRCRNDKYLIAEDDQESVCQDRHGTYKNSEWTVEFVEGGDCLRLRSCYGKYLTASNIPFIPGVTGKKVLQTLPRKLDSSTKWVPIRDGVQARIKTPYGTYLRPNGGLPPWRNSITHDQPHRAATQDKLLWDVIIIETCGTHRRSQSEHPMGPDSRLSKSRSTGAYNRAHSISKKWEEI